MGNEWKDAPPPEIWLQVGEDFDPEWDDVGWYDGGVTWADHKIFDTDIHYILADHSLTVGQANLKESIEKLSQAITTTRQGAVGSPDLDYHLLLAETQLEMAQQLLATFWPPPLPSPSTDTHNEPPRDGVGG